MRSGAGVSPYCFGTGCPCGTDEPTAGCANSTGSGALLSATGTLDVAADDLVLTMSHAPAGKLGLVYMGGGVSDAPFGDGLGCVAPGVSRVLRFPAQTIDGSGSLTLGPGIIAASQAMGCPIGSSETRRFQAWYRDPSGPCGIGSNYSQALLVRFE